MQWVLAALVMAAHFRPWEGGLLEDLALALAWRQTGFDGFVTHLSLVAGRPLHLVPAYLGLWISDGGVTGMYLVLTATAVAQFWVAQWALSPLVARPGLRVVLAATAALHPLWPAGYILRYLPAQVSVLLFILWLGFAVRYIGGGGRLRLVLASAALVAAMLTYQALAVVYVMTALLLMVRALPGDKRGARRGAALLGVTVWLALSVLAYDLTVAKWMTPTAYESGLIGGHGLNLARGVWQAYATVFGHLHLLTLVALLLAMASLSVLVTAVRPVRMPSWLRTVAPPVSLPVAGATFIGALGLPIVALTYAPTHLHLRDFERVGLPVSVALWILLASLVGRPPAKLPPSQRVTWLAGIAAVFALLGLTAQALAPWGDASRDQRAVLDPLAKTVRELPSDARLVLVDHSGAYGDVYTLLPPHLSIAMTERLTRRVDIELCTPNDVPRHHPVADRFPLVTTPDCSQLLNGRAPERILPIPTHRHGTLSLLIFPQQPPPTLVELPGRPSRPG